MTDTDIEKIWRNLRPRARALVLQDPRNLNTSEDFPRELVARGLLERMGEGMLGHTHCLRLTSLGKEVLAFARAGIQATETKKLARHIDTLVDMDTGMHWCPDLAGLIASAPADLIDGATRKYGDEDYDAGEPWRVNADHPSVRVDHEWTYANVVLYAIVALAECYTCDAPKDGEPDFESIEIPDDLRADMEHAIKAPLWMLPVKTVRMLKEHLKIDDRSRAANKRLAIHDPQSARLAETTAPRKAAK